VTADDLDGLAAYRLQLAGTVVLAALIGYFVAGAIQHAQYADSIGPEAWLRRVRTAHRWRRRSSTASAIAEILRTRRVSVAAGAPRRGGASLQVALGKYPAVAGRPGRGCRS
jgi:hypothetical protein